MHKFLQKIFTPIFNVISAKGLKIGETSLLTVYKKNTKDGTEILTAIDNMTGKKVKIVEKFSEFAGGVADSGSKIFQSMNRKFVVTNFQKGEVADIMFSKINTDPAGQVFDGKVLNIFSPTTEVARVQKRVFDLKGNWQKDVEFKVNKPGCWEVATKHEVYPNNYAYCTSYEKGKAPELMRSSITNICRSLKV